MTVELAARRANSAWVVLRAGRVFREALLPLVLAALFSRGISREGLLFAGIGIFVLAPLSAFAGWISWKKTTYGVRDGAVFVDSGVFSRKHVAVPVSRVEGLDVTSGPVLRRFGVVGVMVQAAGGGKQAELVLPALDPAALDELRAAIGLPVDRERQDPAWALGGGLLLAGALTWGRIGIVAPIVAGAFGVLDDIGAELFRDRVPTTPGAIILLAVVGLGAAWLLSIVAALVSFGGFRVWREPGRLRVERGLVQRRTVSIPTDRIRAVRIIEGVLRQPFGLAMVRLEVAGFRHEGVDSQLICPVIRRRDIPEVLGRLVPELAGSTQMNGPPTASLALSSLAPLTLAIVAGAATTIAWGAAGAAGFLAVPVAAAFAVAHWRAARIALRGERLVLRFRRLARSTVVTDVRNVQRCDTRQGPLARLLDRASLIVGAGSGRLFAVPDQRTGDLSGVFRVIAERITRRTARPG